MSTESGSNGVTYYMLSEAEFNAILTLYPEGEEALRSDFRYTFEQYPGYYFADPGTIDPDEWDFLDDKNFLNTAVMNASTQPSVIYP